MQNSKLFQMIFIPIHLVKYSLSYGDSKTQLIFSFENSRKTGSLWKLIFENVANISIFDFPDLSDAEFQALSDDLYPNSFGEIFIELWWFKDTTDFQFWKFTKNRFTLKVDFWKCIKYFHFWFSRPVWCRIPSSFRWSLSQFIWWNIHWVMVIQRHNWFSVLKIHEKQVHFESWFLKMYKIFPFLIFQTCLMQNSKLFQMIFIPIHLVKYSLSYGDSKTPLIFSFENSRKIGSLWKLIFENLENISIFDFPDLSDAEFQALSDDLYPNSFGEIFIELWWFKDTTDFSVLKIHEKQVHFESWFLKI